MEEKRPFRVAILDMNNGVENQGIRGIEKILIEKNKQISQPIVYDIFQVRNKQEIPDLSYDAFISSGGPGSPFDGLNSKWEGLFFNLLDEIVAHNKQGLSPKYMLLICHSFQLACRKFNLARVIPRYSNAFGVFPVYLTPQGERSILFEGLNNPFYALDSRDWQVVRPVEEKFNQTGAKILALEKDRPQIDFERCIMAIQFTPEIYGTQFHPEADPEGLKHYFSRVENKDSIVSIHSEDKYEQVLDSLFNPEKIKLTQESIIPNFLKLAGAF